MKTNKTFEIEIMRHNVTPSQFLSYVRHSVDNKGGKMLRSDLDLDYFRAGNDLNFDIHHEEPEFNGLYEKSISKPYEMQTYLRYADGAVYNEICEFTFDDEKTGHGYYYLVNVEAVEEEKNEEQAVESATEEAKQDATEEGDAMMAEDLREDWDAIPQKLRDLVEYMGDEYAKGDESDEAWNRFEALPVTIGFGDKTIILPTCAQSFNELIDFLRSCADEFEA